MIDPFIWMLQKGLAGKDMSNSNNNVTAAITHLVTAESWIFNAGKLIARAHDHGLVMAFDELVKCVRNARKELETALEKEEELKK